ncbi:MAG TPA: FAD:protein FMN transferase [Microbacterium sp.]|uniref:FAD:protein FMN transferase n=1 Tax=Microbacterium sp. TaxID=51671 RepID=UPI002B476EBA|nr:FAD:protein FMN transferase [Microbacterium sp.]HKT56311.1 FAD:protein FMN transferase [Microbacterium sp.]
MSSGIRYSRIAHLMGTVFSVHVIGAPDRGRLPADVDAAIDRAFADLADVERVFSPFRADSDVSRLRDGHTRLGHLDPRLAEIEMACRDLALSSGGRFSGWRDGWFDPTGYVKGWATERAARAHLASLTELDGVMAVGLNAGGDIQAFTAPESDHAWRIGIADPRHPGSILATVELRDGAVATSGIAERGAHITDPRTGRKAVEVLSATTVADGLTDADAWATIAVVAGTDLSWVTDAPLRSGLIVGTDGTVRRFAAGVELACADPFTTAALSCARAR